MALLFVIIFLLLHFGKNSLQAYFVVLKYFAAAKIIVISQLNTYRYVEAGMADGATVQFENAAGNSVIYVVSLFHNPTINS
jgi:hypothetical protein